MRWFIFLYGLLTYLLAIRSLVYFVLFASNVPWVKTVDSGPTTTWAAALAIDVALLLLFTLPHSLLAREWFTLAVQRRWPAAAVRSSYVLLAALTLSFLMWQWRPIDIVVWETWHPVARPLLIGLSVAGWILSAVAYYSIGHLQLLGLRQALDSLKGEPQRSPRLVTTGVYRYLRNPMYLGFALGMWSTPQMSVGRLLLSAGMTLYVLIGLRYERRDLLTRFGQRYHDYLHAR